MRANVLVRDVYRSLGFGGHGIQFLTLIYRHHENSNTSKRGEAGKGGKCIYWHERVYEMAVVSSNSVSTLIYRNHERRMPSIIF